MSISLIPTSWMLSVWILPDGLRYVITSLQYKDHLGHVNLLETADVLRRTCTRLGSCYYSIKNKKIERHGTIVVVLFTVRS